MIKLPDLIDYELKEDGNFDLFPSPKNPWVYILSVIVIPLMVMVSINPPDQDVFSRLSRNGRRCRKEISYDPAKPQLP